MSTRPGLFDFEGHKARSIAAWSQTDWADIATFIGPNAARFEANWAKTREKIVEKGNGVTFGFCWPALFFSFAWFFARKQWATGGVLLVLPIVLAMLLDTHGSGGLGALIVIAMIAKSMYLQAVVPKVHDIIGALPAGTARDDALRAAGGISMPGAVVGGIILAFALTMIIMTIMA